MIAYALNPTDTDHRRIIMTAMERRKSASDTDDPFAEAIESATQHLETCEDLNQCTWPAVSHIIIGELRSVKKLSSNTNAMVSEMKLSLETRISPIETKVKIGQWLVAAIVTACALPLVVLITVTVLKNMH
jgi:hypothetical protein